MGQSGRRRGVMGSGVSPPCAPGMTCAGFAGGVCRRDAGMNGSAQALKCLPETRSPPAWTPPPPGPLLHEEGEEFGSSFFDKEREWFGCPFLVEEVMSQMLHILV